MSSRAQAGQDTLLGEEHGSSRDAQEGTLFLGIFLLEVGECGDEGEWEFGLGFDNVLDGSTGDNQDVELGEAFEGFFHVDVGAEGGTLVGSRVLRGGDEGAFESFGC